MESRVLHTFKEDIFLNKEYILVNVCCKCTKVIDMVSYKKEKDKRLIDISHTYCEKCHEEELKKIEEEIEKEKSAKSSQII